MENKYKICAVVVTYNRKELLVNCLNAINSQTYKPHTVLIVDNASTDGTKELVEENGYYNVVNNGISYKYLLLPYNQGGAGGFYHGMKMAYESNENYDAVWVMDDDGVPDSLQLKEMLPFLTKFDFISPLVKAKEDNSMMAFYNCSVIDYMSKSKKNVVCNEANPFNGILFSRKLIAQVGYPMKEMFIWGDEINYWLRCQKKGFYPITVISAVHVHPKDRQVLGRTRFNKLIRITDVDWKLYCLIRNNTYNRCKNNLLSGLKNCWIDFLDYSYYYKSIHQNKDKLILSAIFDALFERWYNLDKWKCKSITYDARK